MLRKLHDKYFELSEMTTTTTTKNSGAVAEVNGSTHSKQGAQRKH